MNIIILAAGTARRMGRQKLLLPVDGRPLIQRVIDAAARWPTVVVCGDDIAAVLGSTALRLVRNDAPERGMAHSLALADQVVARSEPIAVLPADLPDITADQIAAVIAAYGDDVDIVAPLAGDVPAHPVIFGPRARRKIAELPDGDTLHHVRDDPNLRRRVVQADAATARDLDTPADYDGRNATGPDTVETSR